MTGDAADPDLVPFEHRHQLALLPVGYRVRDLHRTAMTENALLTWLAMRSQSRLKALISLAEPDGPSYRWRRYRLHAAMGHLPLQPSA